MRRLILSLFLITNSAAWATGTPDNQPQVVIPVTPLTDLADFDYSYTINQMHLRGMFIELTDGTLWEVAEMGPESKIFFANREVPLEFDYVEDLTVNWQPGESLIFHKLSYSDAVLVYNVDRDQLFNVTPFLPPLQASTAIAFLDPINQIIGLNDNSLWQYSQMTPSQEWFQDQPVVVAKSSPWNGLNTHVLINLCTCFCDSTVEHIHPNQIGVNPAN